MERGRNIFLIALVCSLCVHLLSFGVYLGFDRHHRPARAALAIARSANRHLAEPDEILVYPDMGESTGTGIGSNSSPGETPLVARQADEDQALLSRDTQGTGKSQRPVPQQKGPTGDGSGGAPEIARDSTPAQTPSTPATPQTPSSPTQAQATPMPADPAPAKQVEPPTPAAASPPPPDTRREVAIVLPVPEVAKPPEVTRVPPEPQPVMVAPVTPVSPSPSPQKPSPPATPPSVSGDGRQSGTPLASADSLPQNESDSDPFSRISGTIEFHDGRLNVRMGRKVKTTNPQIRIAGQIDALALNNPTVVLEVHIDKTGKVTDVRIAHTSGSNQIDEPTRLAVYEWWFEPAKNKLGQPISDVVYFTVQYL